MILSLGRVKPLAKFTSPARVRYRNVAPATHGTTRIRDDEVFHAAAVEIRSLNLTTPGIRPIHLASAQGCPLSNPTDDYRHNREAHERTLDGTLRRNAPFSQLLIPVFFPMVQ
jgi:hypothetical protein